MMPTEFISQAGAIPFRVEDGKLRILLISNRHFTRWVVPKGLVEPGQTLRESAAMEAWEEAGVRGKVGDLPLGDWVYDKLGMGYRVSIFAMEVTAEERTYPEAGQRQRRWLSPRNAKELVKDMALAKFIDELEELLAKASPKK